MPQHGGGTSLLCARLGGFIVMSVALWVMVLKRFFWTDVWVGEVSLRDRFTRLYELSVLKEESVFEMSTLGCGVGGGVELEV